MGREWTIPIEGLTADAFAPFGRIVQIPATPATSSGPGWQCWYGFQVLDCPWPLFLGAVATEHRPIVVTEMERHVRTFELLSPHGHALIQPVAPPASLDDQSARPDPSSTRAFRIPVGSAIIMHPGTWHSCAFPEHQDTTYTFACLEPDDASVDPWVPFADSAVVRVVSG